MKKVLLCLILSFFLLGPGNGLAQHNVDILHYKFEIAISDSSDQINGRAHIKMKALENTSSIIIDLTNVDEKTNKGMRVTNVTDNKAVPSFEHDNDKLTIKLTNPLKKGEERNVSIQYLGVPADGLIISKNKYGHRTFFADNWPNRGHGWIPCVDSPADKASVEFIVTAPSHYDVVSNGIFVESTSLPGNKKLTHWKEDVPVATKVMVIGVADFAVNIAGTVDGCIPVSTWVYPEDRDKGFYDYAQALEILPFFIRYVGPYGYKKLANVQSKTIFGGLENANTIFYAENTINGKRKEEDLMAHEIAHQWFGNMATEKSFAHLWLSEGFATYMTILYMENKYGVKKTNEMLIEDRQQVIQFARESDRPVVDESSNYMELLNPNSYQKGGWILHMLRRQLGDSIFQKSIRNYYAEYAGKNADTRDLQHIFETTSSKDLSQFFTQWLYNPGLPKLDIKWRFIEKDDVVTIIITQLQKNVFQFPLEIKITTETGKTQLETLHMTQSEQTFTIPVKEAVKKVDIDPNVSLLFDGTIVRFK